MTDRFRRVHRDADRRLPFDPKPHRIPPGIPILLSAIGTLVVLLSCILLRMMLR